MTLTFGSADVTGVHIGSVPATAMYVGAEKVWPMAPATVPPLPGVLPPVNGDAVGTVAGDIAVPVPFGSVVADDGTFWVAAYGAGEVWKIVSGSVAAKIATGTSPKDVKITPDGSVYVSNLHSATVTRIVNDAVVAQIPVSANPSFSCVAPDGALWVCHESGGVLTRIVGDAVTKTIIVPGKVLQQPCFDTSGQLWAGHNGGVVKVDTTTDAITDINTGVVAQFGCVIADPDGSVWAVNTRGPSVTKFVNDVATLTIPLGSVALFGAKSRNGNTLYIAQDGSARLAKIVNGAGSYMPIPGPAYYVSTGPDGTLYVSDLNNNLIYIVV